MSDGTRPFVFLPGGTMKTFLRLLMPLLGSVLLAQSAFALPALTDVEQRLNTSATAGPASLLGTQIVSNKVQLLKCTYNYATQGGTTAAAINMKDVVGADCTLPSGAIVKQVITHVVAAVTSNGSATVSIGAGSTTDLMGSTAKASLGLNVVIAGTPVGTAATAVRLTAAKVVKVTVGTAVLTAGRLETFIEYFLGL